MDGVEIPNNMFFPGITFDSSTLEFTIETNYQVLIGVHDYYITSTFSNYSPSAPIFRQPTDGVLTITGDVCDDLILFEAPYSSAKAVFEYSG